MNLLVNLHQFLDEKYIPAFELYSEYNLTRAHHRSSPVYSIRYNARWYFDNNYKLIVFDKHLLYYIINIVYKGKVMFSNKGWFQAYSSFKLGANYNTIAIYYNIDMFTVMDNRIWSIVKSYLQEIYLEKSLLTIRFTEKFSLPYYFDAEIISYFSKYVQDTP